MFYEIFIVTASAMTRWRLDERFKFEKPDFIIKTFYRNFSFWVSFEVSSHHLVNGLESFMD